MNWVSLIVILIALAVWIVASIIGSVQNQQAPRRNLPKPAQQRAQDQRQAEQRQADASALPLDTVRIEEQERKAEDIQKKRKAQAERHQGAERQRQVERDQVRRRTSTVFDAPAPAGEPSRREQRTPEPAPPAYPRARSAKPDPTATGLGSNSPLAVAPLSLVASLGEAAQVKRAELSPVAKEIRRLLHDRKSLAAAFVLREIFDPPLAMRKRNRGPG